MRRWRRISSILITPVLKIKSIAMWKLRSVKSLPKTTMIAMMWPAILEDENPYDGDGECRRFEKILLTILRIGTGNVKIIFPE